MKISLLFLFVFLSCGKTSVKSSNKKQNPSPYYSAQTLTVNVFYEPGAEPYISPDMTGSLPISLDYWSILETNLNALFEGRTSIPRVVVPKKLTEMSVLPTQNDSSWTISEVQELNSKFAKSASADSFNVYFLNGHAAEGSNIIGFHINASNTVAIFKEVVRNTSSGIGATPFVAEYVEQATLVHEIGHALGLVNNGVAMVEAHQDGDPNHGKHCSNPECVMYYSNEGTSGLIAFVKKAIETQSIVMFDRQCRNDARAYKTVDSK